MDIAEHARALEREITALANPGHSSRDDAPSWDALLDSVIRGSGCDGGFIGEITTSEIGIDTLRTRAHSLSSPLPTDSALAVAEVIAGAEFSIVDSADGERRLIALPLVADSHRASGVVGLVGRPDLIDASTSRLLGPLVDVVAGIADSLAGESSISGRELEGDVESLASAIGSAAYGMVVVDGRGVVEIVNEAAQVMLGLHEIELIGSPLLGFLQPADLEWIIDLIETGCHERVNRRTMTLLEGSEFSFRADLTVNLVQTADRDRAVLMFRSVESELQAQAVARRAADLLAITPDLVLWADDDGRIEYLNAGGRELLGVDDCSTLNVADVFPQWAFDAFDREIRPMLDEQGTWTGNLALVTSSGEEIPASITFLLRDEGPDLAVMARDLRSQQHLDMLQEAFVSTVSHELRTPLSAILGYLEMFADADLGPLSEEQVVGLEAMQRNGARLLDLVNQLLQVASVGESGPEDRRAVDLSEVVSRLIGSQAGWSERVELTSGGDPDALVMGSESELTSLVTGLVENGIKFSDSGVEVRLSRIEPWVEVAVEDHGVGIPEAELDRVFDRFFRASNARELEAPGAGLGLAIARAIVHKHGGEIAIDSELGAGTTTRVLLPAFEPQTRR